MACPGDPGTIYPYVRFDVGGPVHPSRMAGRTGGIETALRLQPVYSSVRLLAEGVAQLPIQQYRDTGDQRVRMPLGQLLQKPSAYLNRFDWLFQYVSSAALGGTAYGLIAERDGYGYPTTIEWLPPEDNDRPDDPAVWAKTNPALGIQHANGTGLMPGFIANELATMDPDAFARERLSVGDYPADEAEQWAVIGEDLWTSLADEHSAARAPFAFAVEVGPERRMAAIAAAGLRGDGRLHVEVTGNADGLDFRPGTDWVPGRLAELVRRWRPCAVVIDPGSHAGALIEPVEQAGIEVVKPFSARDAAAACSQFYDAVQQKDLRHLGQGPLTAALAGAKTRPLGDQWAWDRKNQVVDISPLVACTLAAWGFNRFGRSRTPHYDLMRSVL